MAHDECVIFIEVARAVGRSVRMRFCSMWRDSKSSSPYHLPGVKHRCVAFDDEHRPIEGVAQQVVDGFGTDAVDVRRAARNRPVSERRSADNCPPYTHAQDLRRRPDFTLNIRRPHPLGESATAMPGSAPLSSPRRHAVPRCSESPPPPPPFDRALPRPPLLLSLDSLS